MNEKSCGCVIIENDSVLLVKQTKGHWGFPKGHVEKNETEEETAIREVKEETNLDVKIPKDEKKYKTSYETDKGNSKEVVYFIAKLIKGNAKPQEEEVTEIEWVKLNEAVDKLSFEDTKKIMRSVCEDLKQTTI